MVRPIKPEFTMPVLQIAPTVVAAPILEISEAVPVRSRDERLFAAAVTLIFFVAALLNVWHHVMWRDELRAWQIAAVSRTPAELHYNLRYEGHPILFYLILWVATKITHNVFAMQMIHVVLASGVVFVFALLAPFTRWIRALFCFGYFPFFEYATISRSYSLLFLLFLIGVAMVSAKRAIPVWLAVIVFLMSQVTVLGPALGGLLVLAGVVRWIVLVPRTARIEWQWWLVPATTVLIAGAICYLQMLPGPGPSWITPWPPGAATSDKITLTIGTVWKAWAPLPQWTRTWWNTNVLDKHGVVEVIASLVLVLIAMLSMLNRPAGLVVLVLGVAGLLVFAYFFYLGEMRHYGQLFMVLIGSCWIAESSPRMSIKVPGISSIARWFDAHRVILLSVLLAVSVVGGVGANVADWRMPFSASRATAEYIRSNLPPEMPIAGMDDWCIAPVAVLLNRPIYSFQMRTAPAFCSLDDAVRYPVTTESMFDELLSLNMKSDQDVLLMLSSGKSLSANEFNVQFPPSAFGPPPVLHILFLARFYDSTVPDEVEALYRVHRVQ